MNHKATRKISTSGKYSKVINLPRKFLRTLKWRQNQNLSVELDKKNQRLIIKDAKR